MTDRRRQVETPELRRLRRRIDALDRRLVALLNERAVLARDAGRAKAAAGRRAIRDAEREREVLLRVSMANEGPLPQADLLALYRRLFAATKGENEAAEHVWIIDPLDGTTNFLHGFPYYCVSIALAHQRRRHAGHHVRPDAQRPLHRVARPRRVSQRAAHPRLASWQRLPDA